jgi:hypothetical protein
VSTPDIDEIDWSSVDWDANQGTYANPDVPEPTLEDVYRACAELEALREPPVQFAPDPDYWRSHIAYPPAGGFLLKDVLV